MLHLRSKIYRIKSFWHKNISAFKRCILHYYFRLTTHYSKSNYKDIPPIIINNFNRLAYLKRMLFSLQSRGYSNIIILDNSSTYPPLLEWYKNECKVKVIKLERNYGHTALWASGIIKHFWNDYFVYSDPDLELVNECPNDFLWQMLDKLMIHVKGEKIALSIKIDDIPDEYHYKSQVLKQETRFFQTMEYGMYVADVDTTFAIYEPRSMGGIVMIYSRLGCRFRASVGTCLGMKQNLQMRMSII